MPFTRRYIPPQPPTKHAKQSLHAFYGGTEAPAKPKPRKPQRAPERLAQRAIRQWLRLRGVLSFRNNVGRYQYAPGKWVTYGLCVGSSDVIVPLTVTVTQAMVGTKVALFGAL